MVLKHPSLGQGLAAGLEERTHLDRVGPLDGESQMPTPLRVGSGNALKRPQVAKQRLELIREAIEPGPVVTG